MSKTTANGRNLLQEARMVMHEDERAIIKAILLKAVGDDDYFAKIVSSDGSEHGRAEDRLVIARFLVRMERQFELRAQARAEVERIIERSAGGLPGETESRPPLLQFRNP